MTPPLKIVIFGLSITSSWGNGHATTYRSLVRELSKRGHDVLFLERDTPWYRANRDLLWPCASHGHAELYRDLNDLKERFSHDVREASFVMVGSYVPEGCALGRWVLDTANGARAFYDIDTPVTMAKIKRGDCEYISPELIRRYDLYLSFTGGPITEYIEKRWGSPMSRPLYCSADPEVYYPCKKKKDWDIGYLGTYSDDRQPILEKLMLDPARKLGDRRFIVAGALYPAALRWPHNVRRVEHLPPSAHRDFYNSVRFAFNVTRADMVRTGYSPSVRLFEAASCGTPIISDYWEGLDRLFRPGLEILISNGPRDTIRYLNEITEDERRKIGERARMKVLSGHTAAHRVDQLEGYMREALKRRGMNGRERAYKRDQKHAVLKP
ncbi:MAG: glycosyltransferase [Deltaproteobacteria bacterium]|nr:glycosyltransferase [Deltaproteobacteria bacterium]